jgi:hypothetical protein
LNKRRQVPAIRLRIPEYPDLKGRKRRSSGLSGGQDLEGIETGTGFRTDDQTPPPEIPSHPVSSLHSLKNKSNILGIALEG